MSQFLSLGLQFIYVNVVT